MLAVAAVVGALGAAELLHRRAARRGPGAPDAAKEAGRTVVVVLGYPPRRDGRLHPIQRWRVEIAVRSTACDRSCTLVFTGGARPGEPSEAEVMAAYARSLGVPPERLLTETRARNTVENIEYTLRAMAAADRIVIASDPLHAARARRYLRELRPDLARRLAPADDYRPLEHPLLKLVTAAYEVFRSVRLGVG